MRRLFVPLLSAILIATLFCSAASAQLPGFGKKRGRSSSRVKARVGDEPPQTKAKSSSWGLPSFQLPKWQLPSPRLPLVTTSKTTRSTAHHAAAPAKPSTWSRMKSGTSNFMQKTTSFLMPWKKKKKAKPALPPISQGSEKKGGFSFTGWLGGSQTKSEPKAKRAPNSVSEFIGLPRVGRDKK